VSTSVIARISSNKRPEKQTPTHRELRGLHDRLNWWMEEGQCQLESCDTVPMRGDAVGRMFATK
jgi:hypothetical protein